MCGIVAYIGPREAYPVVLKGLKRLEYRGYDSAGVALLNGQGLKVYKKKGKVAGLEEILQGKDMHSHIAIGHTRWATHGEPSDRNAHPHTSKSGRFAMIHNGIIENYAQLKQELVKKGKVAGLEEILQGKDMHSHIAIGHTRWATHGEPSDRNAHPHTSKSGRFAMIHNGIIENYAQLKQELVKKGYEFTSDTDTEVLLNFIEDILNNNNCSVEEAVRIALKRIVGAYVIVIIDEENPDTLIAARKGSPLVIGIGKNEHFLASDASPIIEYTKEVVYVNDYEVAIIKPDELILKNLGNEKQTPFITKLDMELAAIEKGGYDNFMLKEIFEQPQTIHDCLRGRLDAEAGTITMSGIEKYANEIINAKRIVMVACGTSWHAGLVAEYIFEELCRINVEVEYASEFRYRNPVISEGDVIIAISQSGETADTLVAIENAKSKGAIILGVVNVVGSSIARVSHAGAYTHAGPEIGVASTKAFTAQLAVLTMIALHIGYRKGTIDHQRYSHLMKELDAVPEKVTTLLQQHEKVKALAEKYKDASDFLYLGRGYNFPVALEGALKLKEITYIHAEGYPAAEMKHGPIALVDETLPVVFIATRDSYHEKVLSNMQEIKARKGKVIAVITEGDEQSISLADDVIMVPEADEIVAPMLSVIPMQLLAYYIGVAKNLDVDKPRNLAKSVTVE